MEDARKWTQAPVFDGGADAGRATGAPQQLGIRDRANRFISGLRRRALFARHHYWAAEGANDVELARLARSGARLRMDDVRWQNMRTLPSGVRHV